MGTSFTPELERILAMSPNDVFDLYDDVMNPALQERMRTVGYRVSFRRGFGSTLWDASGKRYLDCLGGYGATVLGHNHTAVVSALTNAMQKGVVNLAQAAIQPLPTALAAELARLTGLQHTFFSNSGAEAVEAAIKMARRATKRQGIVSLRDGYHGKTYGALTATGQEKYHQGFGPLVPEFLYAEPENLGQLRDLLCTRRVAAVILEPIQGEGGVRVLSEDYLWGVRSLCNQFGSLLIMDEIQTGLGRTGTMFRYQAHNLRPDIVCLAKGLGGGLIPIGATIASDQVWHAAYGEKKSATLHTSTFGGNGLACVAALATLHVIREEGLVDRARETGAWLKRELEQIQREYPTLLAEVRGEGMMLGLEFRRTSKSLTQALFARMVKLKEGATEGEAIAGFIASKLLERGVVTAFTLNREDVIRIAPPITTMRDDLCQLLTALREVLANFGSLWGLAGGAEGVAKSLKR